MTLVHDGRIVGTFEGYGPGRLYALDNGFVWEQVDETTGRAIRESPRCRLLCDRASSRYYLDVLDTGAAVEVRRHEGRR